MCLLALPELQDADTHETMIPGDGMLARPLDWVSPSVAALVGSVGAVSVFWAVHRQKRDIKCACVGGSARVPLGFVSFTATS